MNKYIITYIQYISISNFRRRFCWWGFWPKTDFLRNAPKYRYSWLPGIFFSKIQAGFPEIWGRGPPPPICRTRRPRSDTFGPVGPHADPSHPKGPKTKIINKLIVFVTFFFNRVSRLKLMFDPIVVTLLTKRT